MLSVFVNTASVIIGGLLGVIFKKGIPEKVEKGIMSALGLCVVFIGVAGTLKGENQLVTVISMVFGTVVGTLIDIDNQINRLGEWVEKRFNKDDKKKVSLAEGFVTASLLFCVGAMAVTGSLEAGLGLPEGFATIYTKSAIDFVSAIMLASTLGIGVCLSGAFVLLFQGAICLLSGVLEPVLTVSATNELICVGSLMIMALGLNMLGITKLKVANFLPALIFAPAVSWLITLF